MGDIFLLPPLIQSNPAKTADSTKDAQFYLGDGGQNAATISEASLFGLMGV